MCRERAKGERSRSERDAGTSNDHHRDKDRPREVRRDYADNHDLEQGEGGLTRASLPLLISVLLRETTEWQRTGTFGVIAHIRYFVVCRWEEGAERKTAQG